MVVDRVSTGELMNTTEPIGALVLSKRLGRTNPYREESGT
jgi:hypothetical protein